MARLSRRLAIVNLHKGQLDAIVAFAASREDDVNMVNLAAVPVDLQMRILDTGTLLCIRNRSLLADFQAKVVLRYCDFKPVLDGIYRDYDAGLREEFSHGR